MAETSSTYVVYRRSTGEILGTYGTVVPEGGSQPPREQELKSVLPAFAHDVAVKELAYVLAELPHGVRTSALRVDARGKLIPKHHLRLASDRAELDGDGKDSIDIAIEAVDDKGKRVSDFDGEIQVTTTRGRLSERGGRVHLKKGAGQLRLTATVETAVGIRVTAVDPTAQLLRGTMTVSFL